MDPIEAIVLLFAKAFVAATASSLMCAIAYSVVDHQAQGGYRSPADVRRAAEQYRLYYGDKAVEVIADHILGAALARNWGHRGFLRRVRVELERDAKRLR